jgi:S-adenosylhomocysteine hydrolase
LTGVLSKLFFGEDRKPLNMILDDGGDLTNMVLILYRINSWNQRFI